MAIDVTHGGAVLAGLVSFLSPCVLPLVPPYLCYMAGVSLDQLTADGEERVARRTVLISAVAFVLGFATIFVSLGAAASAIGQLVRTHLDVLSVLGGIIIIVMGLHFLGVFRIPLLYRQARIERQHPAGPIGSYVMGLAFAFGWTPCIGPVLAAILAVAGTEATVTRGAGLLAAYSLGLGIPFLLAGLFAGPFMGFMRRFRAHLRTVEKVMGAALVLTGVLFITGNLSAFSYWLLATFPVLGTIG
ncbi:MAG TPA: cytochrome c biogenesis protein CcdA [Bauldia sp.]|nr:cytochrome c biogenesis protein CcdA [Bauldia sp.]